MPFILKDAEDTMALGQILASAMNDSSVRDLYLFADLGGGKTTLYHLLPRLRLFACHIRLYVIYQFVPIFTQFDQSSNLALTAAA